MKTFRLGLLCCLFLFFGGGNYVKASHLAGGYITYSITSSTSHQRLHFKITILRSSEGITMPQNLSTKYIFECDSTVLQVSAYLNTSTVQTLAVNPCSYPNSGPQTLFEAYTYEGHFDILNNRQCKKGIISLAPQNARIEAIDNLINPSGLNFYMEAKINELAFALESKSPDPTPENLYFSSCINQTVTYGIPVGKVQGDSLYFQRSTAKVSLNTPAIYAVGYSQIDVLKSNTPNIYNSSTGQLEVNTNTEQLVTQVNIIKQYRLNPVSGIKELVGITPLERLINVNNSCKPLAFNAAIVKDTISYPGGNIIDTLACAAQSVELAVDVPIEASSITPNGSEFAITNSAGYLLPVIKAYASDSLYQTRQIRIEFGVPVDYNDTLTLVTRKGSDFDGLVNICGIELAPDTALLIVQSCSGIGVSESQVSTFNTLFPNPMQQQAKIHCKSPSLLQIYDLNGKKLKEQTLEAGITTLNLNLQKGVYLVHITSGKQHSTQKIIVQP